MSGHQVTIRWHAADFSPLQRGQKVYKTPFMVGEATTVVALDRVITWNLRGFSSLEWSLHLKFLAC